MSKHSKTIAPEFTVKIFLNDHEILKDTKGVLLALNVNILKLEIVSGEISELRIAAVDHGSMRVEISPTVPIKVIDGQATWNINLPDYISGYATIIVYTPDVPQIIELKCLVMTSLSRAGTLEINGKPFQAGTVLWRGTDYDVTFVPFPGTPIGQNPIALSYKNVEGDSVFKSNPSFTEYTTPHHWKVTPTSGAGSFQFSANGQYMSESLDSPICRLEDPGLQVFFKDTLVTEGETIRIDKQSPSTLTIATGAVERVLQVEWAVPNGYTGISVLPSFPFKDSVPLWGQGFSIHVGLQFSGTTFAMDIKLDDGAVWKRRLNFSVAVG